MLFRSHADEKQATIGLLMNHDVDAIAVYEGVREKYKDEFKGIMDTTKVLCYSDNIPYISVVVRGDMTPELKEKIKKGLSLLVASGGHSSSRCAGLSPARPLLLRSTGSRRAGSVVVAHGPSCYVSCGIFPAQGSNLCPLHWQADSQPLSHQGSPEMHF